MGLTQDLTGLIEPRDGSLRDASPADRKWYYARGAVVLRERHRIQLSRGIGANGRAMKPRLIPVLPDGADGPVMEPHYDRSRAITLATFRDSDRGLKLFWQAGTGHRDHRRARAEGKKATPFGTILGYHADGLVRNAPVRDVRLSKSSIHQGRLTLEQEWAERLAKRKKAKVKPKPKPEPKPEPEPTPKPKGASTKFTAKQVKKFKPPPLPKIGKIQPQPKPDELPSGVPVIHRLYPESVKGPTILVTGKRDQKRYPETPRGKKPPPAPPAPPKPAPKPRPLSPAAKERATFDRAASYAAVHQVKLNQDGADYALDLFGVRALAIPAFYHRGDKTVYLNPGSLTWRDKRFMAEAIKEGWFSSDHPDQIIHHEVGHALHHRAVGDERYAALGADTLSPEDAEAIKEHVSGYAATQPIEFVAEVYAGLVNGRVFLQLILDLYRRFGGPFP